MEEKHATQSLQAGAPDLAAKPSWDEVFAALDAAQFPHDFLGERDNGLPQAREELDLDSTGVGPLTHGERRTAKVFMSGRSQAVRIPAAYRFKGNEVYMRRDPHTGDLILSEKPSWEEIFAELRAAKIPPDFFGERDTQPFKEREELP